MAAHASASSSSAAAAATPPPPPSYVDATADAAERSFVEATFVSDKDGTCRAVQLGSLTPFQGDVRTPIDLIAVIDVSGSMKIANKPVAGCEEAGVLTRMQRVVHAMRIIMENLCGDDFLTMIVFDHAASVLLPRCPLTPANAAQALQKLEAVPCVYRTNLFDGLKTAYTYARLNPLPQTKEQFYNRHMLVLTDGRPNEMNGVSDESAATNADLYLQMMDAEYAACPANRQLLVHTVGICYDDLDAPLLGKIARHGRGMYTFISDPIIIAPCFINLLAVWFHMWVTGLELQLHDEKGVWLEQLAVPWILQSGQVDILLTKPLNAAEGATTSLRLLSNTTRTMRVSMSAATAEQQGGSVWEGVELRQTTARKLLASSSAATIAAGQCKAQATKIVAELKRVVRKGMPGWTESQKVWLSKLIYDVDVHNRIKADALALWEPMCLHALALSLQDDFISNGYEQSHKTKAGPRLTYWLDHIEGVAKNIVPPNPKIQAYVGDGGGSARRSAFPSAAPPPKYAKTSSSSSYAPAPAAASSSSYFSSSSGRDYDDGCIDGDCLVTMADGSTKPVKHVRIGDQVRTNSKLGVGTVRCLLSVPSNDLIELSRGLRLTHMHPVFSIVEKDWVWPYQLSEAKRVHLANPIPMFSFLLEKPEPLDVDDSYSSAMEINGWWVVHFAHQNTTHPILAHPFYGTEQMRDTVERLDPNRIGLIHVTLAVRDAKNIVTDYEGRAMTT